MLTDKYTTYKCETCGVRKPVDQVHSVYKEYPSQETLTKWRCRRCFLDELSLITCDQCAKEGCVLYEVDSALICGPCIAESKTVQDALSSDDGLEIDESHLGTDEPEEEDSCTTEEWEALAEEAV